MFTMSISRLVTTAALPGVFQHCQIPALIVDSVDTADVTSPRQSLGRCPLHDRSSYTANVTCRDTGRVLVIHDHDVCRVKRLSMTQQVLFHISCS